MSAHGHPSARERHDAAALERALARREQRARAAIADLADRERHARAVERARVARVLLCEHAVLGGDFEGCVD